MTLSITPLQPTDIPAALALSTQAGWNQFEADWRRLLELWPQSCFAGRLNGELIATATLATHGTHVGWVGMVLVEKDHRGNGYSGEMLDKILSIAESVGVKTLGLDATEQGRDLYLTRGFRDVDEIDRWVRTPAALAGKGVSPKAGPVLENAASAQSPSVNWESVLALDSRALRLSRERLLTRLRDEPGVQWRTVVREEQLLAFAMLRPGRTAAHIGPVIAENEEVAGEVLDRLLIDTGVAAKQSLVIDVPTTQLTRWLAEHGFKHSRPLDRMQAGIRGPDLLGTMVFAGSGFELG